MKTRYVEQAYAHLLLGRTEDQLFDMEYEPWRLIKQSSLETNFRIAMILET